MKNRLSLPLLVLSTLLIFSCSPAKNNSQLLTQAEQNITSGDVSEAIINLKNILKTEPNHAVARYLLGKIYLNSDNYQGAKKELIKSLAQDPNNQQAILLLAKTYLSLSEYTSLIELLENKTFADVNDQIYALLLSAQAYLNTDNIALAKDQISEANDLSSDSSYSMLGQAFIAAYENSSDEALKILEEITNKNNNFLEAWLLKGSIYSNSHQYKKAAQAYEVYYKQKPQNFGIETLIAHNYIKSGDYQLAKPYIEHLIKLNGNHPTVNLLAAQLKYIEKDYRGAKELANKVINSTNNGLAKMIAGLCDFYLGNLEQSYYQLNAIAERLPKSHHIHRVLALLQVKLGYNNELIKTIETVSANNPNDAEFYSNLAVEYNKLGDTQSAVDMFNKASQLDPDNTKIKAQLGIVKLKNKDNTGIKDLEQVVSKDPKFESANITLAMNYLKNNEMQKAIDIADSWIKKSPKNVSALILRGNIAIKSETPDEASSYFKRALNISPENIIALFNLAVLSTNHADYKQSNIYLEKLFQVDLEYPYAYRLAITNALHLKTEQELETKILSFIKKSPEALWPRIVMARRLTVTKKYDSAFNILNELTNYAELPYIYFQTITSTLTKGNNYPQLEKTFEKWVKYQPSNELAYLDYIDILDQQQDYKKALSTTKLALQQKSLENNLQLKALEAYYLLATMQIELANKKISLLANQNPKHAFVLRLQGQLALARQNYPEAIKYLSQSLKGNSNIDTKKYLVNAFILNKQPDDAVNLINKQLEKTPDNKAFLNLLAQINIQKNPDVALEYYMNSIKQEPKNFGALNNLAWLFMQKGDLEKASMYAEEALNASPKNTEISDTYSKILIKQNKIEEAIHILNKAYEEHPHSKRIMLSLKEAYLANNNKELANEMAKKILSKNE